MTAADNTGGSEIALHDKTGALLMLNKQERKLIKELLLMTLNSETGKKYLKKRLGDEYVGIGQRLLKTLGG